MMLLTRRSALCPGAHRMIVGRHVRQPETALLRCWRIGSPWARMAGPFTEFPFILTDCLHSALNLRSLSHANRGKLKRLLFLSPVGRSTFTDTGNRDQTPKTTILDTRRKAHLAVLWRYYRCSSGSEYALELGLRSVNRRTVGCTWQPASHHRDCGISDEIALR